MLPRQRKRPGGHVKGSSSRMGPRNWRRKVQVGPAGAVVATNGAEVETGVGAAVVTAGVGDKVVGTSVGGATGELVGETVGGMVLGSLVGAGVLGERVGETGAGVGTLVGAGPNDMDMELKSCKSRSSMSSAKKGSAPTRPCTIGSDNKRSNEQYIVKGQLRIFVNNRMGVAWCSERRR